MPEKARTNLLETIAKLRRQLGESERARREQSRDIAEARRRIKALERRHKETSPAAAGARKIVKSTPAPAPAPTAEPAWHLLDEFGSDLLFYLDASAKITLIAHAAAQALGMDDGSVRGRSIYDFVLEDDWQALKNYLRVAAQQKRVKPITVRCRDKAEQACDVEMVCRRLPEESWLGRGWVGLARPKPGPHDGLSAGELELTAGLAHELSQPLTTIGTTARACVRLIRSGEGDPAELLEAAEQVARQAERAAEIIRRLRDLVTEGKRYSSPTDLNELVQETTQLLRADIEKAQVALCLRLAPDLPPVVLDRIQISQVLGNLVRNALEAMQATPAGDRQIEIETARTDGEVVVSVADRGTGLSVEMVNRLFEPFQTTKPHGMGVGLALCRSIVQAHGGRIAARPNGDRGTTFFFSVPLGRDTP
jgi:signal transduction histidine kinase